MAVAGLVITGANCEIVKTTALAADVAVALVAVTCTLKIPLAPGVPEMRPLAFTLSPAGRPVAP